MPLLLLCFCSLLFLAFFRKLGEASLEIVVVALFPGAPGFAASTSLPAIQVVQ